MKKRMNILIAMIFVALPMSNRTWHTVYSSSSTNQLIPRVQIHSDQLDEDSAEACQDPTELIDQNIRCRDNRSGKIIEYIVVDYIKSFVGGDYFTLEDQQGRRYNVTPQELEEIRID
jgi:hypothetical protein